MGEQIVPFSPQVEPVPAELSLAELVERQKYSPQVLSRDEEALLGNSIQAGLSARDLLESGEPVEASEQEEIDRIIQDGAVALQTLVSSNTGLVAKAAKWYGTRNSLLQKKDLEQEGYVALLKAAKKFDPSLGFKFSSLASVYIRGYMTRALLEHRVGLKYPKDRFNQATHPVESIESEQVEDDTLMERPDPVAYDLTDTTIEEYLIDDSDESTQRLIEAVLAEIVCNDLLSAVEITPAELEILTLRFGLNGTSPLTLAQVGEIYDRTPERIRQIEQKAILKLKDVARRTDVLPKPWWWTKE